MEYYEAAQELIISENFVKVLKERKNSSENKTNKKEIEFLEMIEEDVDRISLKAIEVALLNEEYYKVIKWGYRLLTSPKYETNKRALMARARAYIEIDEFELALKDLKIIKMLHPKFEPAHQ